MIEERGPMTLCVATFYKNTIGATEHYYGGAVDILTCDAIHAVDTLRWMGGEVKNLSTKVFRIRKEKDD